MTKREITINTTSILQEIQDKGLRLCSLKEKGIFMMDDSGNLFSPDVASHCFYIKHLLSRQTVSFKESNYTPVKNEVGFFTGVEIAEGLE